MSLLMGHTYLSQEGVSYDHPKGTNDRMRAVNIFLYITVNAFELDYVSSPDIYLLLDVKKYLFHWYSTRIL